MNRNTQTATAVQAHAPRARAAVLTVVARTTVRINLVEPAVMAVVVSVL